MINYANMFKSKAFLFLGGIVLTCALAWIFFNPSDPVRPEQAEPQGKIQTANDALNTEELWQKDLTSRVEEKSKALDSSLAEIQLHLQAQVESEKELLRQEVLDLREQLANFKSSSEVQDQLLSNQLASLQNSSVSQPQAAQPQAEIIQHRFNLDSIQRTKTVENYIPAGSLAKAVLVSGVDASCALSAASDPDPILIKITDYGSLPGKFRSDLKDCRIIGAAYGDISSERARIRLEQMSCVLAKTREIIEIPVTGYVTGEDGRQGIRGEVVSTESKLLTNSFFAGILGGVSENLNPKGAKESNTIVLKNNPQNPSFLEKMQSSASIGTSNSLDRLSKYYIERAESIQPVVQVGAGRKVDVIFTKGAFFTLDQDIRGQNAK